MRVGACIHRGLEAEYEMMQGRRSSSGKASYLEQKDKKEAFVFVENCYFWVKSL